MQRTILSSLHLYEIKALVFYAWYERQKIAGAVHSGIGDTSMHCKNCNHSLLEYLENSKFLEALDSYMFSQIGSSRMQILLCLFTSIHFVA